MGKVAITKTPTCFSQDCQALIGDASVLHPEYSLYYLSQATRIFKYRNRGTTISGVTKKQLSALPLPLPPLAEQRRIVAKIEELFTRLDAGIEALKKIKAQLKRYRQAVLKHVFEGKLTEEWRRANKDKIESASVLLERIRDERKKTQKGKYKNLPLLGTSDLPKLPEGWVWTNVSHIGEVTTGTTPTKAKEEFYGYEYPFYKPTDLNEGYYVKKSEDGLSCEGFKYARVASERSILVTCIGATIGKTGFLRKTGAFNQQINAISPSKFVKPEFLYFICISPQFQNSIVVNASATTLPILNKSKFETLNLPLPSFTEQEKIVDEIERRFSVADEVEKVVDQSLRQVERLRQSILKRAFQGKLVPQDPDDEPAEKLLERIKAEKAKETSKSTLNKKVLKQRGKKNG